MFTELKNCQRCLLRETCGQVVTGIGPASAKLILVGMNPGPEEDLEGEPFVGRYRRLLEIILTAANIPTNVVYITYLVKCSPKNRKPPKQEYIDTCKFWLWKELTLIKPRVVVPLGRTPTRTLLLQKSVFEYPASVGRLHDVSYMGARIAPWWSLDTVFKEGVALRQETINFFSQLKASL